MSDDDFNPIRLSVSARTDEPPIMIKTPTLTFPNLNTKLYVLIADCRLICNVVLIVESFIITHNDAVVVTSSPITQISITKPLKLQRECPLCTPLRFFGISLLDTTPFTLSFQVFTTSASIIQGSCCRLCCGPSAWFTFKIVPTPPLHFKTPIFFF
jgi:hypothetical protein